MIVPYEIKIGFLPSDANYNLEFRNFLSQLPAIYYWYSTDDEDKDENLLNMWLANFRPRLVKLATKVLFLFRLGNHSARRSDHNSEGAGGC